MPTQKQMLEDTNKNLLNILGAISSLEHGQEKIFGYMIIRIICVIWLLGLTSMIITSIIVGGYAIIRELYLHLSKEKRKFDVIDILASCLILIFDWSVYFMVEYL